MKLYTNRNGQLTFNNLLFLVITLFTVAVVIAVVASVQTNIQNSQVQSTASNLNQTIAFTNNTAIYLGQLAIVPGSEKVYGGMNRSLQLLNIGRNYTMDYDNGAITPLNETPRDWYNLSYAGGNFNVSYSYYYGSPSYNISKLGLAGTNTFASYFPTVAIVSIAVVLIGMIAAFFLFKKPE